MPATDLVLPIALVVGVFASGFLADHLRGRPVRATSRLLVIAVSAVSLTGGVLVLLDGTFLQFVVGVMAALAVTLAISAVGSGRRAQS